MPDLDNSTLKSRSLVGHSDNRDVTAYVLRVKHVRETRDNV